MLQLRSALLRLGLAVAGLTVLNFAHAAEIRFNIPSQEASSALQQFRNQSKMEVIFAPSELKDVKTKAVQGEMEPSKALQGLLLNTGFEAEQTGPGNFAVRRSTAALRQGSVDGQVQDPTGVSISNARVSLFGSGISALTDRRGRFVLVDVPAGSHILGISGEGMQNTKVTDVVVKGGNRITLSAITVPARLPGAIQLEDYVVSAKRNDGVVELDRYDVEGARIKPFTDGNVDIPRTINDAQAYYMFDAKQIDRSGAANIEDFLKQRLTMATTAVTNSQLVAGSAGMHQGSTSNIGLNGLDSSQTLILVDGRRMPNVGYAGQTTGQPDLNGIPLGSVDHIEILPSSSSGIYGGGALGGVINIVLKQNYNGGEIKATYGSSFHGRGFNRSVSVTSGQTFEGGRTRVMLSLSYSDREPVLLQDLPYLKDYAYRAVANDKGTFTVGGTGGLLWQGGPTKFFTALTTPFPGTAATFTSVPPGTEPSATPASLRTTLIARAGNFDAAFGFTPNSRSGFGLLSQMGAEIRAKSFSGSVSRQMTPYLQSFLNFGYSENHSGGNFVNTATVSLAATSPINPFGVAVTASPNFGQNASQHNFNDIVTRRLTAGFILNLPHGWKAEGDYTWTGNKTTSGLGTFSSGFVAAMQSGAINIFSDLVAYPPDLEAYKFIRRRRNPVAINNAALRASGPLRTLPGGPAMLSLGLDHRQDGFGNGMDFLPNPIKSDSSESYNPGQSHTDDSVYVETLIPIVGSRNAFPGVRLLDLQLVGRQDNYTVHATRFVAQAPFQILPVFPFPYVYQGAPNPIPPQTVQNNANYRSTNVTVGLRYKPTQDITFRASYATAFLPPTYEQLQPGLLATTPSTVLDPQRGNTSTAVFVLGGGNVDLTPENDKAWAGGVIFTPRFAPGLRLSIDYNRMEKSNNIATLSATQIVNTPAFAGRVTRAAASTDPTYGVGAIQEVNASLINVYSTAIQNASFQLDYRRDSPTWGATSLSLLGTRNLHYRQQTTFGAQPIEYLGFASQNGPISFKASGGLTWEYGRWVVSWSSRYYSRYTEYGPPLTASTVYWTGLGSSKVPAQLYHDVVTTFKFPSGRANTSAWQGALSRTEIQVGLKNLFNTPPPFDPYYRLNAVFASAIDGQAYYLRQFFVSFKKAW